MQHQDKNAAHRDNEGNEQDTTSRSLWSSIPSDRLVDYPLSVFRKRQQNQTLPILDRQHATIDISHHDYRAFALLIHASHGAVLLHCTRKKKKPPHYQLPGGHVDDTEFESVCKKAIPKNTPAMMVTPEQLFSAARMACAREIYEETTIDLRSEGQLDRLLPLLMYDDEDTHNKNNDSSATNQSLPNEYKQRLFFVAQVFDSDFSRGSPLGSVRYETLPNDHSCNLMLQLSVEHSGFQFGKTPQEIVQLLQLHSGGKVAQAVAMAYSTHSS